MELNSINNINNLNPQTSLSVEKNLSSDKIAKIGDDSLSLSINQYNEKRDILSLDVQSLNEGIAASKISENSLAKQDEYLNNIKEKLEGLRSENNDIQNKNDIKDSINEDLKNFNQVGYETKFKNQNLLNVEYYDEQTNIEINTQDRSYILEKPNTPQIASDIFDTINTADLNDNKSLNDSIDKVETSSNQLQNIVDKFTEFGNRLENHAKATIEEQRNLYENNKLNKDKNFGNESTDFTKTNVSANSGYLAASQANIVQEQSVKLLS